MRRKVIQLSETTLGITLPSSWIKQNNIKKGDELLTSLYNNEIILRKDDLVNFNNKEILLDLRNKHPIFQWLLFSSAYVSGYDTYRILSDTKPSIRGFVNSLIGLSIVDETKSSLTIKSISNPNLEIINEVILKLFFEIRLNVHEIIEDHVQNKIKIEKREEEINALVYFIMRALNKNYSFNNFSLLFVDSVQEIYGYFKQFVSKTINLNKYFLINFEEVFFDYMKTYSNVDIEKINDLLEKSYLLHEKSKETNFQFLFYLIFNSIKRILPQMFSKDESKSNVEYQFSY